MKIQEHGERAAIGRVHQARVHGGVKSMNVTTLRFSRNEAKRFFCLIFSGKPRYIISPRSVD